MVGPGGMDGGRVIPLGNPRERLAARGRNIRHPPPFHPSFPLRHGPHDEVCHQGPLMRMQHVCMPLHSPAVRLAPGERERSPVLTGRPHLEPSRSARALDARTGIDRSGGGGDSE